MAAERRSDFRRPHVVVPLIPCPFCGGAATPTSEEEDHWYECDECGACGPAEDTPEEAVAAWNERYAVVGRDERDTHLMQEALQRHGHYLVRRMQRPNALPDGADAHALARLRELMRHLGFVAPEGKGFW